MLLSIRKIVLILINPITHISHSETADSLVTATYLK